MIVSRAGLATMGIADAIMVSRYSPAEFAALSLADGTLGRVIDIFAAFVIGGLILVPRAFGAGNLPEAMRIWKRSIFPAVGLGLLGLCIGLLGTTLFHVLGQNADLAANAGSLSAILGFGYVAALLAIGAAIFLEGVRQPVIVAVSVVLANIINISLNWLLIGGHFGFAAMGARGSAISTTIVRFALAIILVAFALRTQGGKAPSEAPEKAADTQHLLGLSAAVVQAIMIILTASLLVFAGWIGPLALAALSAVWTLNAPVMLIALGVADATGIRVAASSGQSSMNSPRFLVAVSAGMMAVVMLLFVTAWSLIPGRLASVFTGDHALLQMLVPLIPIAAGLLLFDSLSFVVLSALRALRDIAWPTGIEIGSMVALVPLALWMALKMAMGARGLVIAALASAVLRTALLLWRFLWLTRVSIIPVVGSARSCVNYGNS